MRTLLGHRDRSRRAAVFRRLSRPSFTRAAGVPSRILRAYRSSSPRPTTASPRVVRSLDASVCIPPPATPHVTRSRRPPARSRATGDANVTRASQALHCASSAAWWAVGRDHRRHRWLMRASSLTHTAAATPTPHRRAGARLPATGRAARSRSGGRRRSCTARAWRSRRRVHRRGGGDPSPAAS
jgi:hypothetical protein